MRVFVEQFVEWRLAGETEVLGENLPQRHFVPPQIPHDHTRARTRAAAVGSQRQTAWAMARPNWKRNYSNVRPWICHHTYRYLRKMNIAIFQTRMRKMTQNLVPAKIRTEHLQNTYLETYHYTNQLIGPYPKFVLVIIVTLPVTVAERSKTWTLFARSETGIVGSNPTQDMECLVCVCVYCVCVVLCLGRGLATGWSPVQGVLPSVK
jgi:hypothetical protein